MPTPHERNPARTPPLTLLVVLAMPAQAQELNGTERKPEPVRDELQILDPVTPSGRRFFDGVIAMVGDRAILLSTIKAEVGAVVEGKRNANETVGPSTLVDLAGRSLRQHVSSEVLAQSARLTDSLTPTELKEMLSAELQRYLDEMVASFGSYNAYLGELERLRTTWEEEAQKHTDDLLQQRSRAQLYANVMSRTGNRTNLWVTPREMRRYYEQNAEVYKRPWSAEVERVLFQDQDSTKAMGQATAAVAAWRANPSLDPEAVAQAHGGLARPLRTVLDRAADESADFIKAFAKESKPLQVSDPIGGNGTFWVLRLRRVQGGVDGAFSDPKVQKEITGQLVQAKYGELTHRLFERNSTSLFMFIQPDLWRL